MKHRPAVTLLEVLVSIFIMGIGMLALLTLFPLGAVNMAQALRDDRIAATAAMANSIAIAQDLRHDVGVVGGTVPGATYSYSNAFLNPYANNPFPSVSSTATGPSYPVLVDPFGFLVDPNCSNPSAIPWGIGYVPPNTPGFPATGTPGVPRRTVCLSASTAPVPKLPPNMCAQWFALPDDITFQANGTPDLSSGGIDRGGRYTCAYLMRRPQANSPSVVDLSIIVYAGRSTQSLSAETPYAVDPYTNTGAVGTNTVNLVWNPTTQQKPSLRRGGWILDATWNGQVVQGYFYRVVNVTDLAPNKDGLSQVGLELQTNIKGPTAMNIAVVMDDVAEVIDKGSGWGP